MCNVCNVSATWCHLAAAAACSTCLLCLLWPETSIMSLDQAEIECCCSPGQACPLILASCQVSPQLFGRSLCCEINSLKLLGGSRAGIGIVWGIYMKPQGGCCSSDKGDTQGQLTRIWWPKTKAAFRPENQANQNQSKSFQDLLSDLHLNEWKGECEMGGGNGLAGLLLSSLHFSIVFHSVCPRPNYNGSHIHAQVLCSTFLLHTLGPKSYEKKIKKIQGKSIGHS